MIKQVGKSNASCLKFQLQLQAGFWLVDAMHLESSAKIFSKSIKNSLSGTIRQQPKPNIGSIYIQTNLSGRGAQPIL